MARQYPPLGRRIDIATSVAIVARAAGFNPAATLFRPPPIRRLEKLFENPGKRAAASAQPTRRWEGTWVPSHFSIDFMRAATGCPGSVDLRRRSVLLGRRNLAAAWGADARGAGRGAGSAKALGLANGIDRVWVGRGGGPRDRDRADGVRRQQRGFSARVLQRLGQQQLEPFLPVRAAVGHLSTSVSEPI
jgi:hypothetical protein